MVNFFTVPKCHTYVITVSVLLAFKI